MHSRTLRTSGSEDTAYIKVTAADKMLFSETRGWSPCVDMENTSVGIGIQGAIGKGVNTRTPYLGHIFV